MCTTTKKPKQKTKVIHTWEDNPLTMNTHFLKRKQRGLLEMLLKKYE